MLLGAVLGMGRSKQEVDIKKKINQRQLNSSTFEQVNKNSVVMNADATIQQKMNVTDFVAISCVPSFVQTATVTFKQVQQFSDSSTTKLVDAMAGSIKLDLKDDLKQKSGLGAGLFGADQTTKLQTDIETEIENTLKQTLTNESLNEIVNKVQVEQTLNTTNTYMNPCGFPVNPKNPKVVDWTGYSPELVKTITEACTPRPQCPTKQDANVAIVSEQIVAKALTALAENTKIAESLTTMETVVSQAQEGLSLGGSGASSSSSLICSVVLMLALFSG